MYDLMRQGRYDLMPALLTSREAADAVDVTPRTIERMCASGKLDGARFGNRSINRDSLLRYSGLLGPGKEATR